MEAQKYNCIKATKIWTNSELVKERIDDELKKRRAVIHDERAKRRDQREAKAQE